MRIYSQKQQGFVILFAVLISAVILLIGAGVFSISVKESILSSAAREAQYAINAADMGLECILYDDIQPTPRGQLNGVPQRVDCLSVVQIPGPNPFLFEIPNPQGGKSCAEVTRTPTGHTAAEINQNPNLVNFDKMVVISRGFNICNGTSPALNDPLLVERVMRATYLKSNLLNP